MSFTFCFQSASVVAAACMSFVATAAPVEQVIVVAMYRHHVLQVTRTDASVAPRHAAGSYFEWVNEREFLQQTHLVEGGTYRVKADVQRIEAHQFPEGWGSRAERPYSTYYLYAKSATRLQGLK